MTYLIAEAQANFSMNLLRELAVPQNGANLTVSTILSPISVAIALSMVYAGAKQKTAEEMNQVLAKGCSIFSNDLFNQIWFAK